MMTATISSVAVSVSSARDPLNDQDEGSSFAVQPFISLHSPFLCTQRMACSTMRVMHCAVCVVYFFIA